MSSPGGFDDAGWVCRGEAREAWGSSFKGVCARWPGLQAHGVEHAVKAMHAFRQRLLHPHRRPGHSLCFLKEGSRHAAACHGSAGCAERRGGHTHIHTYSSVLGGMCGATWGTHFVYCRETRMQLRHSHEMMCFENITSFAPSPPGVIYRTS